MRLSVKLTAAALCTVLCASTWAASPDIRVPKTNMTRLADCAIWLCLPMGFTNGDCSQAMSAFSARQVRIAYKRIYTDLPYMRFCQYNMYVRNSPVRPQNPYKPYTAERGLLADLMNMLIPAAHAEDMTEEMPEDLNTVPNEYGEFGGGDPDIQHTFQVHPIAVRDPQTVCRPGAAYRHSSCNGNGSNCRTYWTCSATMELPYQEWDGERCLETGERLYDIRGILIHSGTRTEHSGQEFCNRLVNRTGVFVRGELQGDWYRYDAFIYYRPGSQEQK